MSSWQFSIDVGGTFTDVVARRPDGRLTTFKLLSSGAIRGEGVVGDGGRSLADPSRIGDACNLWAGYRFTILDGRESSRARDGAGQISACVTQSDPQKGCLSFGQSIPFPPESAVSYELRSDEEAPIVAIRCLMGLRLGDPIGPVEVRLGTTRATNALLERKGARTAFVTTRGFGDVLKIGYQDRPELFALNIRKRDELAETVIEIDERIDARGGILAPLDEAQAREALLAARAAGMEAVAICLLHGHVNPAHEERVARLAESAGFSQVSISSRVSRLEKMVPRGDTTVVDAYLSSVIRGYVASLRRSMPQARLRLMTSSGGLIDAALASGKDTILSGPAGGVVGCAQVSRAAGSDRAIGFDMGGTSTDVSRIEPPRAGFDFQHETVKAGVRIMTPMLAVETVAAGGGSVCAFDGQKLTVGPHSAGADPGPACYGRGGPLTITDMNLLLGRIAADHFPFRLDREVVARLAGTMCAEVNAATASELTPTALAEGFIRIANANMAAAIRRISIAKGYDAREYTLTTFGGAGGQHACAIARMLGIARVLCSPYAGVLSALGIGVADVQRIGEQTVAMALNDDSLKRLGHVFDRIAEDLRGSLLAEGEAASTITTSLTLDVCYEGQSTLLGVRMGSVEEIRCDFERQHRQLYGYCHDGRAIEIRAARVELTARSSGLSATAMGGTCGVSGDSGLSPRGNPTGEPPESRHSQHSMVIDGEARSVPLWRRGQMAAGMSVEGPAMVIDDTSTTVVDPGWRAEVRPNGDLILTDSAEEFGRERVSTRVDPVQLELFNNQFAAIAEQMGVTLRRTALSVNVKERLDFSCAIFTPCGELVVNAPHIPVHLGGMSDCVKCLIEDVGRFEPGDVYVTNDPFRGGSHLNDVTVITPVHDDAGARILFFVAGRAHHAEIGGKRPGSMPPDSTCLADEGVLIRAFPWMRKGRPCADALRSLLTAPPYPSRSPDENLADIAAQVAANQTGVRELRTMAARYGVEVVHAYMGHIQDAAEKKMRAAIKRLEDGTRRFEDRLDDGTPIRLALTVSGDSATLDFSGTGAVLAGNLNANRSIVTSAVLYCLRCLIDEDIPLNAGVLAPINILLPHCFLNPTGDADPRKCPAVAGGNVETSQRVVDTIFGALGMVAASQGTMNNLLMGNERFGYYETICGGAGAGRGFVGADAVHTHMTNTRLTDPEVLESRYPVRLVRFAIRGGSGGAGHYRGGCGVVREFEFLEPLDVSIISQRRTVAPYGVGGGGSGESGRNRLRRAGSSHEEDLGSTASVRVACGDRLTIDTPGGGGWGKE